MSKRRALNDYLEPVSAKRAANENSSDEDTDTTGTESTSQSDMSDSSSEYFSAMEEPESEKKKADKKKLKKKKSLKKKPLEKKLKKKKPLEKKPLGKKPNKKKPNKLYTESVTWVITVSSSEDSSSKPLVSDESKGENPGERDPQSAETKKFDDECERTTSSEVQPPTASENEVEGSSKSGTGSAPAEGKDESKSAKSSGAQPPPADTGDGETETQPSQPDQGTDQTEGESGTRETAASSSEDSSSKQSVREQSDGENPDTVHPPRAETKQSDDKCEQTENSEAQPSTACENESEESPESGTGSAQAELEDMSKPAERSEAEAQPPPAHTGEEVIETPSSQPDQGTDQAEGESGTCMITASSSKDSSSQPWVSDESKGESRGEFDPQSAEAKKFDDESEPTTSSGTQSSPAHSGGEAIESQSNRPDQGADPVVYDITSSSSFGDSPLSMPPLVIEELPNTSPECDPESAQKERLETESSPVESSGTQPTPAHSGGGEIGTQSNRPDRRTGPVVYAVISSSSSEASSPSMPSLVIDESPSTSPKLDPESTQEERLKNESTPAESGGAQPPPADSEEEEIETQSSQKHHGTNQAEGESGTCVTTPSSSEDSSSKPLVSDESKCENPAEFDTQSAQTEHLVHESRPTGSGEAQPSIVRGIEAAQSSKSSAESAQAEPSNDESKPTVSSGAQPPPAHSGDEETGTQSNRPDQGTDQVVQDSTTSSSSEPSSASIPPLVIEVSPGASTGERHPESAPNDRVEHESKPGESSEAQPSIACDPEAKESPEIGTEAKPRDDESAPMEIGGTQPPAADEAQVEGSSETGASGQGAEHPVAVGSLETSDRNSPIAGTSTQSPSGRRKRCGGGNTSGETSSADATAEKRRRSQRLAAMNPSQGKSALSPH